MQEIVRIELECDEATNLQARDALTSLLAPDSEARHVQRRNLDGDAATWIVIASLATQVIPHLLNFVTEWRRTNGVIRFKIGDIEIENPTERDLEILRERLSFPNPKNEPK